MEIICAFSWGMLVLGIYYVALGVYFCFPQSRAYALGKLERAKGEKNVRVRDVRRFVVVPHWTQYTYSYTVNGKTYKKSGADAQSPRQLPNRPRVVYMKWMPRYAFVSGLTVFQRPFWGFALICVSSIFLIITK
jgi:hypothetical protein